MNNRRLKFGLVGTGAIAQTYGQAFEQCETAQLVGVTDIRQDTAVAFSERWKCSEYKSYQLMCETAGLDGVVICTPPVTHPEICMHFLGNRINVLCEKPFSIDVESAKRMARLADETGAKLTMASKFRYVDDVVRAKSIVDSGILGEIVLFENTFASRVDMSRRWNSDPEVSGGGVLVDNGTHSVDIMRYFLGPLIDVQVIEGKRIQGLAVEDTVRIFARSERGAMGSIDLSWSINKEIDNYISIYGSQGTILVGWKESKYRQASSKDWIVFGRGYDKIQAFRSQINNFSRAIQGLESLVITAQDAIASVEAITTACNDLLANHWVLINGGTNEMSMSTESVARAS